MLLRAYEVYGGETPKNTAAPDYSDFDAVDDWARSSVATLSQWGVMNGSEEGSFSPQGLYTTEQCLVTFLRTDLTGRGGRSASYTYFVYQEGGIKSVDLGLHRIQSGLVERIPFQTASLTIQAGSSAVPLLFSQTWSTAIQNRRSLWFP